MIRTCDSVVNSLGDELSKKIYLDRIKYSNGHLNSIEAIILHVDYGKDLIKFMDLHCDDLYVFGAGVWGQELVKTWNWKYRFCGFIDNNKKVQEKKILGLPVFSLESFLECNCKAGIIIATRLYWNELCKQLEEENIEFERIFNLGKVQSILAKKQYFDLPDLKLKENEVFVDAGAFDGETSVYLYNQLNKKIGKVFLFEPDCENAKKCKYNMEKYEIPHEVINKGIWSESKTLNFNAIGNGASCIVDDGNSFIEVTKMDEELKNIKITFIKMDIEGAEVEALCGCENIIKSYHPRLAICIYHKSNDIDLIPKLLLRFNPKYKLYLRHYSLTEAETVLYAV